MFDLVNGDNRETSIKGTKKNLNFDCMTIFCSSRKIESKHCELSRKKVMQIVENQIEFD